MSNLIGPAGRLLDSLAQSLAKQDKIKLLLYGPPGVGKTSLAEQLAASDVDGEPDQRAGREDARDVEQRQPARRRREGHQRAQRGRARRPARRQHQGQHAHHRDADQPDHQRVAGGAADDRVARRRRHRSRWNESAPRQ